MAEYQVIARRFRPQKFGDVIGQDAIITTLKNALASRRIAHAYLFTGSRGTGKTTLARILAKALNCTDLSADFEPCGGCSSCKEIAAGSSMEVLEIDGASHRGIDDIRQINETVGYSVSGGGYKIYIIDEVHMLTKEAFNALLKTLEEPPEKVKFFFATTEPHKVLPTILSRCQRFNLHRISSANIVAKLKSIADKLAITIEDRALLMIADRAEGGLRDAESLLDQIFSFHGNEITCETVASVLGIMTKDCLFEFDKAAKEGRPAFAFDLVHQVFSEGKDLFHFIEMLTEHYRNILLLKISETDAPYLSFPENEMARYKISAEYYTQEQCLQFLDYLTEAQSKIRSAPSVRIYLENILLTIIRSMKKIPIELLVRRLAALEQSIGRSTGEVKITPAIAPVIAPPPVPEKKIEIKENPPLSITVDPSPSSADLSFAAKPKVQIKQSAPAKTPLDEPVKIRQKSHIIEIEENKLKNQSHYDTIFQFAAIELKGKLEKMHIKRL